MHPTTAGIPSAHLPVAGHRNRLRYLEIVDGIVYLELTAELLTRGWFGTMPPLRFDPAHDRYDSLRHASISLLMRDRATGAGSRMPLATFVEATPDGGRRYTVRFAASGQIDLRPAAQPAVWNVFTVLRALGTVTTAPVGAHHSRIGRGPIGSHRPDGGRVTARFAAGGSQLILHATDESRLR